MIACYSQFTLLRFNQLKYSHTAAAGVHWIVWVKLQTCIWVERWSREWLHLSCSPALMAPRDTSPQTRTEPDPTEPTETITSSAKPLSTQQTNGNLTGPRSLLILLFRLFVCLVCTGLKICLFVFLYWFLPLFVYSFFCCVAYLFDCFSHSFKYFAPQLACIIVFFFTCLFILLYFHVCFQILSCVVLQDSPEICRTITSLLQPLSPAEHLSPPCPWRRIHLSHWSESDHQEPVALRRSRSLY